MREVLPSHMKPHLFGGRTEIPAQVSGIRDCTPRDGSRALPLGALASLLNVSACVGQPCWWFLLVSAVGSTVHLRALVVVWASTGITGLRNSSLVVLGKCAVVW